MAEPLAPRARLGSAEPGGAVNSGSSRGDRPPSAAQAAMSNASSTTMRSEEEEHATFRSIPWVDDVVERRAEPVAHPEECEVAIRRFELATPRQHLRRCDDPFGEIDLVRHQGNAGGRIEREPAKHSEFETAKQVDAVPTKVVQELRDRK